MNNEGNLNSKRIFLVDKESVNNLNFLQTYHVNASDEVFLVLGKNSTPITNEDIHFIFTKKLKVNTELVQSNEKNVLSMKLIYMIMETMNKGPIDFYVVSNEKDFSGSLSYIQRLLNVQIRLINNETLRIQPHINLEVASDFQLDEEV